MDGRVDLGDWLHTTMVYPPTDGTHPFNFSASNSIFDIGALQIHLLTYFLTYLLTTNPAANGWKSKKQPVNYKSNAVTISPPSHLKAIQWSKFCIIVTYCFQNGYCTGYWLQ